MKSPRRPNAGASGTPPGKSVGADGTSVAERTSESASADEDEPDPTEAVDRMLVATIERLDALDLGLVLALALSIEPSSVSAWRLRAASLGGLAGHAIDHAGVDARAVALAAAEPVPLVLRHGPDYYVDPHIAMLVVEVASRTEGGTAILARRRAVGRRWGDADQTAIDLRVAIACGDDEAVLRAFALLAFSPRDAGRQLVHILGLRPRPDWLARIPDVRHRVAYSTEVLDVCADALMRIPTRLLVAAAADASREVRLAAARVWALRGRVDRARAIEGLPQTATAGITLLDACLGGDYPTARAAGNEALAAMKARKHRVLPMPDALLYYLSLVACAADDPSALAELGVALDAEVAAGRHDESPIVAPLLAVRAVLGGATSPAASARCDKVRMAPSWRAALVWTLHDRWLQPSRGGPFGGKTQKEVGEVACATATHWAARAHEVGFTALGRQLDAIAASFGADPPAGSLAAAFRPRAAWEAALAGLEAVISARAGAPLPDGTDRRELVWEVVVQPGAIAITPRLRTGPRAKRGQELRWSSLASGKHDDLLTEVDARVVKAMAVDPWARRYDHRAGVGEALMALTGSARVVDERGEPIRIVRGTPHIDTLETANGVAMRLAPPELVEHHFVVRSPAPETIEVYERTDEIMGLVELMARAGRIEVPQAGRARLAATLERLSATLGIAIVGDLAVPTADVAADARPLLEMGWTGRVLSARAVVAPMGSWGPRTRPGAGSEVLVAERTGHGLFRARRDFAEERRRIDDVLAACPTLAGCADGELQWTAPDLATALSIVVELHAQRDALTVAWHAGQALDVPRALDLGHLRLSIDAKQDWLAVGGGLAVDDDAVVRFGDLLPARVGTRFVALSEGRFAVLSERLRERLDQFAAISRVDRGDLRVSPALLPLVDELSADLEHVRVDGDIVERISRMREIAASRPRVPRGFGTTLREYQRDGFEWMSRLAEAGLGACLADDMGLGKTVQALALLLARSKLGPQLVVCPTSVIVNWAHEAARFAPSLNIEVLHEVDDRERVLAGMKARDVVVCSYALLASHADAIAEVTFATAVFDEAHALKNPRTQRATASRRVVAGFRLGLTGTPIENHVGELWSLFATLVPGLLGGPTEFADRFASPIAAGQRDRANVLRTILRPFLLRRLKANVLGELPPRTEITLEIPPSREQLEFYEAVRRRAVEVTTNLDPKRRRLGILAEITRLRQAAVDPRVLDPEHGPAGTKLDVLLDRLVELRAEGHRALVFTQFLGTLALVRERLVAAGIEFHELDGATPANERARRIEAFQAGEGDVFVLSLRAGGIGVNLTGADYVFHLDPWWNPAVEDQATDRAHRIGQRRPVTVYRLVSEGTIEQKILALHASKRDLADDLLAGLEGGGALDLDELVGLLQG